MIFVFSFFFRESLELIDVFSLAQTVGSVYGDFCNGNKRFRKGINARSWH